MEGKKKLDELYTMSRDIMEVKVCNELFVFFLKKGFWIMEFFWEKSTNKYHLDYKLVHKTVMLIVFFFFTSLEIV